MFFYKQFLSIEKGALKGQNKQNYKCQNLLIRKYVSKRNPNSWSMILHSVTFLSPKWIKLFSPFFPRQIKYVWYLHYLCNRWILHNIYSQGACRGLWGVKNWSSEMAFCWGWPAVFTYMYKHQNVHFSVVNHLVVNKICLMTQSMTDNHP